MLAEKKEGFQRDDNRSELLDYLMRRFSDKVIKIAYYHIRDRYMAEDICQEVFLRVYKNLDKFCRDSTYFTWIYRITVNLCRDYKASAYFRRMLPWSGWGSDDTPGTGMKEKLLEAAEGGEIFRKVMDLPLKYRTILALYYFEEFTTPEIAHILKIREDTVRARLCRGRKMLKEMLAREGFIRE